jgi:hypothetical protein
MSFYWVLAIKIGIPIAILGLLTTLLRLLSKRRVGTFTCFVIALGAVSLLRAVAICLHR